MGFWSICRGFKKDHHDKKHNNNNNTMWQSSSSSYPTQREETAAATTEMDHSSVDIDTSRQANTLREDLEQQCIPDTTRSPDTCNSEHDIDYDGLTNGNASSESMQWSDSGQEQTILSLFDIEQLTNSVVDDVCNGRHAFDDNASEMLLLVVDQKRPTIYGKHELDHGIPGLSNAMMLITSSILAHFDGCSKDRPRSRLDIHGYGPLKKAMLRPVCRDPTKPEGTFGLLTNESRNCELIGVVNSCDKQAEKRFCVLTPLLWAILHYDQYHGHTHWRTLIANPAQSMVIMSHVYRDMIGVHVTDENGSQLRYRGALMSPMDAFMMYDDAHSVDKLLDVCVQVATMCDGDDCMNEWARTAHDVYRNDTVSLYPLCAPVPSMHPVRNDNAPAAHALLSVLTALCMHLSRSYRQLRIRRNDYMINKSIDFVDTDPAFERLCKFISTLSQFKNIPALVHRIGSSIDNVLNRVLFALLRLMADDGVQHLITCYVNVMRTLLSTRSAVTIIGFAFHIEFTIDKSSVFAVDEYLVRDLTVHLARCTSLMADGTHAILDAQLFALMRYIQTLESGTMLTFNMLQAEHNKSPISECTPRHQSSPSPPPPLSPSPSLSPPPPLSSSSLSWSSPQPQGRLYPSSSPSSSSQPIPMSPVLPMVQNSLGFVQEENKRLKTERIAKDLNASLTGAMILTRGLLHDLENKDEPLLHQRLVDQAIALRAALVGTSTLLGAQNNTVDLKMDYGTPAEFWSAGEGADIELDDAIAHTQKNANLVDLTTEPVVGFVAVMIKRSLDLHEQCDTDTQLSKPPPYSRDAVSPSLQPLSQPSSSSSSSSPPPLEPYVPMSRASTTSHS